MREILFRGKTKHGEWVEGWFIGKKRNAPYAEPRDIPVIADKYLRCYDVKPETVGQYTGLKDRNGTRIFEGDICLCDRNINDYIDKKAFPVEFDPLRGWIGVSADGWSEFEGSAWEYAEVIGNIHDNPELLER